MPIKAITSKTILKTLHFDVNEVEMELPSGTRKKYHNVNRKTAVSVFALTDKKELYLVEQYRYLFDRKILETVAGYINEGEDPLAAAKRELREETGITAEKWTALPSMEMAAGFARIRQPLFLAQDLSLGKQQLDDSEEIEVKKFPIGTVVEMIEKGEINQAGTTFGVLLIDKMIREDKIVI